LRSPDTVGVLGGDRRRRGLEPGLLKEIGVWWWSGVQQVSQSMWPHAPTAPVQSVPSFF